ncbi:hypothetical protein DAPPUDRAFT_233695 [Daphnia pulex]|uniref:Uncharacterized protein n=1 Tax=Daphnia pulex TaxID=6669 RepID=E9FVH2_DAPPU|nr:hypothetical protein DAPPUDRAFT_233695 [Daphnia pulex]|eukprot:EFX88553.1 hypothetical protein DAPPUDRAFT_233695 [Daphnia pulex]
MKSRKQLPSRRVGRKKKTKHEQQHTVGASPSGSDVFPAAQAALGYGGGGNETLVLAATMDDSPPSADVSNKTLSGVDYGSQSTAFAKKTTDNAHSRDGGETVGRDLKVLLKREH